ncbi:MAG TPA: TlpA family protein disulfide reductase [Acidimicrobiia bacterium]|jgi:cytochrome c biogenesis protein CcmG/thiol:disulfide interchange protein DsbE|nr:TlpA family protein disulfide reductase [Acidimicrobiia bacterium]HIL46181.1 TlpA family protein disulfide reductase [Acidimicrobiia bacterium]
MRSVRVKALLVGAVLLVLVGVMATRESGLDRMTTHLVGQGAPPIEDTTIDGQDWSLSLQRGRWVVVNFFSTTCVPCVREHPELVAFAEAHAAADDVRVVTVAFADSPSAVEEFFRTNGGDWPVLATDTGRIAVDWGVVAVPESYLVSPAGFVAAKIIGGVVKADLEAMLAEARGT